MNFALVDCNNFYVSCERAFDPSLAHRPVVVLSSNDGCIISRSPEAKLLGIPMGLPLFKARSLIHGHDVAVRSSNYALYADMSRRVMEVIGTFPVRREVYSIDEAFLGLPSQSPSEHTALCNQVQERILRWTGIPVSIGIGPTKTLAKMANRMAKVQTDGGSVRSLVLQSEPDAVLDTFPVQDVWGVGPGLRKILAAQGIFTAGQLRDADTFWIKSELGVTGLAIVLELRGQICHALMESVPAKKEIVVSRTFRSQLQGFEQLTPVMSQMAERAAARLQSACLVTQAVSVFLETDYFAREPHASTSVRLELEIATGSRDDIVYYTVQALGKIIDGAQRYKKGGVVLDELQSNRVIQQTLFTAAGDWIDPCVDESEIFSEDREDQKIQKAEYESNHFTTNWNQIASVM
jgi:DNA polymerase V